ncbi:hypothetical protein [Actinopolymorpha pittospori]
MGDDEDAFLAKRLEGMLTNAGVAWLTVSILSYLGFPLADLLPLPLDMAVSFGSWLWALWSSMMAVSLLIRRGRDVLATLCAILVVLVGARVFTAEWGTTYAAHQVRLHQNELAELAAEHRAGRLPEEFELPRQLRYLTIDGKAQRQDEALYLPVWQNWRAEDGAGIAYFSTPPRPDEMVGTAAGDGGLPVRHLGDGWWWVE